MVYTHTRTEQRRVGLRWSYVLSVVPPGANDGAVCQRERSALGARQYLYLSHQSRQIWAPETRIGTGVGFSAREVSGETAMRLSSELSRRAGLIAGKPLIFFAVPLPVHGTFPCDLSRLTPGYCTGGRESPI